MSSNKNGTLDVFDVQGANDWQIFQRNENNTADISLNGKFCIPDYEPEGLVPIIRMVREDSFSQAAPNSGWQKTDSFGRESFSHCFKNIPAGGLYRIEIAFTEDPRMQSLRIHRTIHSIGVGDLWVIAGQSNAAGIGRGICQDPPELGAHILRNDESWALAMHPLNENTDSNHPNNAEGCPQHSPYLSFAKILKKELNIPIGLIQTSLGGSPLSRWNPEENGDLYRNMIHCAKLAGGKVKGVLWYQGCSDTGEGLPETYAERFKKYVDASREELDSPSLPFITTQLNRVNHPLPEANDKTRDAQWSKVREVQRQIAKQDPNMAIVPTLGLPLSDTIHNSAAGNLELGARYAQTALGMVYGKNKNWKYPEIRRASRVGEKEILLEFDNVNSLMTNINGAPEDIVVEDEKGPITVLGFKTVDHKPDSISIILERALENDVATVGAGEGQRPAMSLFDFQEHRPVLAFSGIKVEDLKN